MKSGIYSITNTINGRIYVGKSRNIDKRFKQHVSNLKNNSHVNTALQTDFNRYSLKDFIFKLEKETNDLNRYESIFYYLKKESGSHMYNVVPLLDYRLISKEESFLLGKDIVNRLLLKNSNLLSIRKYTKFDVIKISEKLNMESEIVYISLSEYLNSYEPIEFSLSLSNEYGSKYLCFLNLSIYDKEMELFSI